MRVAYGHFKNALLPTARRIAPAVAILFLPLTVALEHSAARADNALPSRLAVEAADPRVVRVESFLTKLHCPVANLAADFVRAADANRLDWRLLPSISVIESGGGKQYRNNNIFGWNNGLEVFPSIRAGLETVAFKLGQSSLYRRRDVLGKLRLYNPDETYPGRVVGVMRRISPQVDLKSAIGG